MKTDRNILIAFLLNLFFSLIELIGGLFTNSIAIISDSVHDFGDAISIGISYILEIISKGKPNRKYTYGYTRYSIIGSLITTLILFTGSVFVIYKAITRIINPVGINYNGMIAFAVFGVMINLLAAYFTKGEGSLNQKAVNLHMLEDVLGWLVVLIGSILMRITSIDLLDPIMSIGVALYILFNSFKNLVEVFDVFLEKTPANINIEELEKHILKIKGIKNVHHIHIWSMDGITNYATMHIVSETKDFEKVKKEVKEEMQEHGIGHVTIELESGLNSCSDKECHPQVSSEINHHHH